ncbi:MAG: hypothetical protein ACLR5G_14010 [Eubacteriales bacterium]
MINYLLCYLLGALSAIIPSVLISLGAKKKRERERRESYDEFLRF